MIDLRKCFFIVDENATQIPYVCFKTREEAEREGEYALEFGFLILDFEELTKLLETNNYTLYLLNPPHEEI